VPAMSRALRRKWIITAAAWLVACLVFFPIFWMLLTGFKTEVEAVATPPSLFFQPTFENYVAVQGRADYFKYAWNSIFLSVGSTLLALAIAIPAAYAMAFFPTRRTKGTLMWMLSTKFMPAVGVLVPIYLLFRDMNLLDEKAGLLIVYTLINLPIVVWMLFSFFKEVPREILEAGRMDGAFAKDELFYLLLPLSLPGVDSTSLLAIILSWNEAFWSLNLTASQAAPLTAFIASFSSPEGLFWAKLSAASTMAIAPIVVFGWMSQRQLVRGLTFGAVK
jgi:sorbitol/mannitol transport system permease protein